MRRAFTSLLRDRRGAAAAEFALVIPGLVLVIFTCIQLGVLFLANAGLQNAVGEGARVATLWPRRSAAQITAEIDASKFGLKDTGLSEPQLVYGNASGQDFVDVTMTYTTSLNLVFFEIDGIELEQTRRAYMP
jgi:Flp pilus assembly protein TadG